jgi:two-component system nitrogen regulation response regulator NtrX
MKGHILIVDDEENILSSLEGILTDEGFSILKAKDGAEALKVIKSDNPDLVLLDIWIPGLDGIQTLKAIRKLRSDLNVIMMSGHGTIETAVRATKLGAFDFIEKPLSLESVISTVKSAMEHTKSAQEAPAVSNIEIEEIIGNSSAILEVKRLVKAASVSSKNILIQGERGTGKEFIAKAIHLQSQMRDMPFIKINCSALKDEEAEDILFGVKGRGRGPGSVVKPALASSKQGGQKGRIEQAEGGTLFLDDIEGLSIKLQNRLIKIIRDKKFKRKWDRRFMPLDARIIASSNQALADEVKKGKFKEGLLNLLKEITINLPSLKDRIEDMPEIVGYFIKYFNVEYGKRIEKIDDDAVEILKNFDWHGNAKELKNVVEHIVMTVQGNTITSKDISTVLPGIPVKGRSALFDGYSSMEEAERAWETEFITHHLKRYNWDITKTAISLNTDRANLLARLKRLEVPISSSYISEGKSGFVLQKTLKMSVVLCGQGLHSGLKTGLILSPLPPNKGIIFGDISSGETVPANLDYVQSTDYATTLKSGMTSVKTVEHIMAVLHMYGITNLLIKIGDEVPIMDGSAADFCQLIEDGGIEEQDEVVEELIIGDKYIVGDVSTDRYIYIEPSERFSVHYSLDYPSPIGKLEYAFTSNGKDAFKNEIAPARTFAFIKDYEKLEEMGLGSGGKLSNVILLDDEKVINTPLRFNDEFVRHKILDIIGDFYLLGRPIRGRITARMTGHTENIALLKKIKESISNF